MPFRILLFISSPEDLDPEKSRLDFEEEEALLFTALDDPWTKGEIDIDVAEDGYFKTLLDRLEKNRYNAVIMSMHGVLARNSRGEDEWGLLFEDEGTERRIPLAGSDIVAGLDRLPRGHRPGLVVLSACRSASAKETAKAIPSVTRRLHESGFERVLGMRLSIIDQAASAFSAELFRRLAQGEVLGRAVNLARGRVAEGEWIGAGKNPDRAGAIGDPYGQWSLPVLMDRTVDGPIADREMPGEVIKRLPLPSVLIGDGTIQVPSRSSFIGRRTETRLYLRPFLEGRTRCLMLIGPGGVGKTTLAGLFARNLMGRQPETRLLGFRAPFDLGTIYEALRREAFDGTEEPALLSLIKAEPDIRKRINELLISLARRNRPSAFMLDNLEAIQDISTLDVFSEHETSIWFLRTVCDLPPPTRVLLTGRYTLPGLPEEIVTQCPVPDAPYGDILRRMTRLELPRTMDIEKKRWIYQVLGGNHRAIEWAAQVLKDETNKAYELVEALKKVEAPPETPEDAIRVVLDAMRQNLLLSSLREHLTDEQDRLLRSLSLYRVPVNYDGLTAVSSHPEELIGDQQRLSDYALLEGAYAPGLDLEYFSVPPVVKELLKGGGFSTKELTQLHEAMGRYHRFQGRYLSRLWTDNLEAIYHFRIAGDHDSADELAEGVAGFYYRFSNFADANRLTEEIVDRSSPAPPWWALNLYGLCQLVLGSPDNALAAFERARPLAPTRKDHGTTLNNISQIYRARGDYDTALKYLEESLEILREIGDRAGEGGALNNISQIYRARGDYDTALKYLEESLEILREIGDRAGEGTTMNNIGQIYDARGDYDTALKYLEESLDIRREIGDKAGMIPTLHNMGHIALKAKDPERAMNLWSEALSIAMETGDAQGIFHAATSLGSVFAAIGNNDDARKFLNLAVEVGSKAGFPQVQEVEAILGRLGSE
jgi:tetratricopeptide (TPR) repeat protein